MQSLVECVPNFSEGRRLEVIDAIVAAISAVPDLRVLDVQTDADHNRSVVTFVGRPDLSFSRMLGVNASLKVKLVVRPRFENWIPTRRVCGRVS